MKKRLNRNSIIVIIALVLFITIVIMSVRANAQGFVEESKDMPQITIEHLDNIPENVEMASDVRSGAILIPLSFSEEITISPEVEYCFDHIGYASAKLNVRSEPNTDSDIIDEFYYNEEIEYALLEDTEDWVAVHSGTDIGFVSTSYVSEEIFSYQSKSVSSDSRKSFEDYRCLNSSYRQGRLQKIANTSSIGIRQVDERYCIALGSYYSHNIGQYIDVVLENGLVIPCILGDAKDDNDTDVNNAIGNDGGCVEFIVDTSALSKDVQDTGDCSNCLDNWNSPVVEIRLYNYISNGIYL